MTSRKKMDYDRIMTSSIVKFEFGFWNFLIGVILLRMRGRNLMKNSSKNHLLLNYQSIKLFLPLSFRISKMLFFVFFYQKIGWTLCDKNMIAASPWKIFPK